MAPIHVRISEVFASLEPQKVAQASCLFGADRLEACPTLHSVPRFTAPMYAKMASSLSMNRVGRTPSSPDFYPLEVRARRSLAPPFMTPMQCQFLDWRLRMK